MNIPVVLIIFNRPSSALRVLDQIRKACPQELFVISDGPRASHKFDYENVIACREIIKTIDWPCKIYQKYSDVNLGCKNNITLGLDWVFSKVDEAIILEDDCVPDLDFFEFCESMLNKFKYNRQVGSISGTNILSFKDEEINESIFFSKFPSVWGWATWARVWNEYEKDLSKWSARERSRVIDKNVSNFKARRYWRFHFKSVATKRTNVWGYQLTFLHLRLGLLSVIPSVNLISNIGFGQGSTHTLNPNDPLANLRREPLEKPYTVPSQVTINNRYDFSLEQNRQSMSFSRLVAETIYIYSPSFIKSILRSLLRKIPFLRYLL